MWNEFNELLDVFWIYIRKLFQENFVRAFIICSLFVYLGGCFVGCGIGCICSPSCNVLLDDKTTTTSNKIEKEVDKKDKQTKDIQEEEMVEEYKTSEEKDANRSFEQKGDYKYRILFSNYSLYYFVDNIDHDRDCITFLDKECNKKYILCGTFEIKEK